MFREEKDYKNGGEIFKVFFQGLAFGIEEDFPESIRSNNGRCRRKHPFAHLFIW